MSIIHTSQSLSAPVVGAPLRSEPPLLQASGLHCNLNGRLLLQGVDLVLTERSLVVLQGDNGAGKSTLLELLHGRRRPCLGSVFFRGAPHTKPQHRIALLPQRPSTRWEMPMDVQTLVVLGTGLSGVNNRMAVRQLSDLALAAFGLEALAQRPIAALSGGEQQRVLLARVLCQQADVLLLDEPFNGLDHNSRADLAQLLLDLVATGKAVVLSHHGVLPELLQHLPGEVDARGPVDHLTLSNGRLC